jgi:hypothetical protein
MKHTWLVLLVSCGPATSVAEPRVMIEDFESGRARWRDAGSGWKKTSVEIVDGGVGGRRAARITFEGSGTGEAWTDLTWPVERWPDRATAVSFWARAPKSCKVQIKMQLGPGHDDLEMWAKTVEVGTGWRAYVVPVAEFTEFIWGHKRGSRVEPARIVGIGFVEVDFPVVFEVDRIGIEEAP